MAREGIPILQQIPKEEILALIEKHGIALDVYTELGISHTTFYKLMKDNPDMQEALENARKKLQERKCDEAEKVLFKLMKRVDEDEKIARLSLNSAQYYLNNQGKQRGYAHPKAVDTVSKTLEELDTNIQVAHKDLNATE
jgi:hypothetical protein